MDADWPSGWFRGVLETLALAVIAEGETYGYLVVARLSEAGLGTVKGGTLYPALNRLEAEGLLASQWRQGEGGPGRKYYTITAAGRTRLEHRRTQWRRFQDRVSSVLAAEGSRA